MNTSETLWFPRKHFTKMKLLFILFVINFSGKLHTDYYELQDRKAHSNNVCSK
jgi:hypothetical protein